MHVQSDIDSDRNIFKRDQCFGCRGKDLRNDKFFDLISIISFAISLQNLDLNIDQNDFQEATARLDAKVDEKVDKALKEIHDHLQTQDMKIDKLLEVIHDG